MDELDNQQGMNVASSLIEIDEVTRTRRELEARIASDGTIIDKDILRVDSFLNLRVDTNLIDRLARAFYLVFRDTNPTCVVTIESSGIAPAALTALRFGLPLIVLKKQRAVTSRPDNYVTKVVSYTKKIEYELSLPSKFLTSRDRVLFIDDFLASGEAATAASRLVEMSGATMCGVGIVIEKSYQAGKAIMNGLGCPYFSLARIGSMETGVIEFLR